MPRGEFELIDAFRARLPLPGWRVEVGSGDDAAVVRAGGARSVVSVDTTVDGTHARLDLGDPLEAARAFGWRSVTTALSDLAACGAAPGEAYVALTVPRATPDAVLLALGDGLGEAARAFGVDVVGGDVTSGRHVVASVTVVGWLQESEQPLVRSGAEPGDLVGVTGALGLAGAGLALELSQARDGCVEPEASAALREAHRRPLPRTDVGARLREAGASAAIDLSDGLLADAAHAPAPVASCWSSTRRPCRSGRAWPRWPPSSGVRRHWRSPKPPARTSSCSSPCRRSIAPRRRPRASSPGSAWPAHRATASPVGYSVCRSRSAARAGHDHRA